MMCPYYKTDYTCRSCPHTLKGSDCLGHIYLYQWVEILAIILVFCYPLCNTILIHCPVNGFHLLTVTNKNCYLGITLCYLSCVNSHENFYTSSV